MKALILRDDTETAVACAQVLMNKGFQVVCVENRHIARALLRIETIDLLVMDERIDGRLTHSIALSAERHNPYVNAILMTDRVGADVDELYDLLPCLYAIAGMESDTALLSKLAISSIETYEEAEARVQQNRAKAIAAQEARDALLAEEAERDMREALREPMVAAQKIATPQPAIVTQLPTFDADLPQGGENLPMVAGNTIPAPALPDAIVFAADRADPYVLRDEIPATTLRNEAELPHFDADAEVQHSPAA